MSARKISELCLCINSKPLEMAKVVIISVNVMFIMFTRYVLNVNYPLRTAVFVAPMLNPVSVAMHTSPVMAQIFACRNMWFITVTKNHSYDSIPVKSVKENSVINLYAYRSIDT